MIDPKIYSTGQFIIYKYNQKTKETSPTQIVIPQAGDFYISNAKNVTGLLNCVNRFLTLFEDYKEGISTPSTQAEVLTLCINFAQISLMNIRYMSNTNYATYINKWYYNLPLIRYTAPKVKSTVTYKLSFGIEYTDTRDGKDKKVIWEFDNFKSYPIASELQTPSAIKDVVYTLFQAVGTPNIGRFIYSPGGQEVTKDQIYTMYIDKTTTIELI